MKDIKKKIKKKINYYHGHSKVSEEAAKRMHHMYYNWGIDQYAIARCFRVHQSTVHHHIHIIENAINT